MSYQYKFNMTGLRFLVNPLSAKKSSKVKVTLCRLIRRPL